jgi:hypothetical protein
MRAGRDDFADFLKIPVHSFGVCVGRDEPGVYPTVGTNGAAGWQQYLGTSPSPNRKRVVARIADGEVWFPCAPKAWSASPHALILKPDFDRLGLGLVREGCRLGNRRRSQKI